MNKFARAMLGIALMVAGASASGTARTATITQAFDFGFTRSYVNEDGQRNGAEYGIAYANFDPSLGRLQSAVFTLTTIYRSYGSWDQSNMIRCCYVWTSEYQGVSGFFDLIPAGGAILPSIPVNAELTLFGFQGPGDVGGFDTGILAFPTRSVTVDNQADLDSLSGARAHYGDFTERFNIHSECLSTTCGSLTVAMQTSNHVTVTYYYDPVPEPTTWALLISGFGITGAMLRRRRAATAN